MSVNPLNYLLNVHINSTQQVLQILNQWDIKYQGVLTILQDLKQGKVKIEDVQISDDGVSIRPPRPKDK
jgi:Na+-transporting NADH:ubiquinone oxidoreductase subunit NqrA